MTPLSRRRSLLTAGSVLAMPAIARYAHAAEITWRIGHVAPVNTPLHKHLLEAADAIAKRSEGRMELKILGEGKAGIQSGLLGQVRNGGIEMTVVSSAQLAPTIVACAIPSTGFLFGGRSALWEAIDGDLGQYLRGQIGTQLGVEVLEKVWDFGFRHITTFGRSITKAEDISGLKIRTQIDSDRFAPDCAAENRSDMIAQWTGLETEHHFLDRRAGLWALGRLDIDRYSGMHTRALFRHEVV